MTKTLLPNQNSPLVAKLLQELNTIWAKFENDLNQVPIIQRLEEGQFTVEDYHMLLLNLRQQVVEGACWISRAASYMDERFFPLRSMFLKHSVTEHRDFRLLEENYESVGGAIDKMQTQEKNIGSEALSAYLYHQVSQPNPIQLLGAMFIVEGLGQKKAAKWGEKIKEQLNLEDSQVSFLLYHGENDESHMAEFLKIMNSGIITEETSSKILKTAKVTARLYRLQLEELNVC
jgi:3-oxoacyl-[acyl-carrier-protein] synthase-3